MNNKWSWNESEDGIWNNELFDEKQDAIACGMDECELDGFYIGRSEVVTPSGVDLDRILENISENSTHEMCDDIGEDYLMDIDKEHYEELEEKFNSVLFEWMKKYNYEPDFYKIVDIEEIDR